MSDPSSGPAAGQTVTTRARLAAAGLRRATEPARPGAPAAAAIGAVTAALGAAAGLTWRPAAQPTIAVTLFCLLLAVTGRFLRRHGERQDQAGLLMAQLHDARDAEAAAAAVAERGRIAGELHDELAHELAGLAIQLQAARKLADADDASAGLRAAIARSADLAKEALTQARQAVGALRGDPAAPACVLAPPGSRATVPRTPGDKAGYHPGKAEGDEPAAWPPSRCPGWSSRPHQRRICPRSSPAAGCP
jgi:signal transduction histidine kinase